MSLLELFSIEETVTTEAIPNLQCEVEHCSSGWSRERESGDRSVEQLASRMKDSGPLKATIGCLIDVGWVKRSVLCGITPYSRVRMPLNSF